MIDGDEVESPAQSRARDAHGIGEMGGDPGFHERPFPARFCGREDCARLFGFGDVEEGDGGFDEGEGFDCMGRFEGLEGGDFEGEVHWFASLFWA